MRRRRRLGKGGREVWLQATYNPILDLNGRPYKIIKLAADITERKRLRNLSITDSLTSLYNRRHADDVLRIEISRARRSHTPLTIALFDLDHFKKINDAFGHGCGDDVLKATAATFLSALREGDIVARYGGEEFLTILPVTTLHEAAATLRRVKDNMAPQIVPGLPHPVTISAGIVRYREGETVAQCLARADRLLYQAKSEGRDRLFSQMTENGNSNPATMPRLGAIAQTCCSFQAAPSSISRRRSSGSSLSSLGHPHR